ncbi:hypothetical protein BDZ91DRAFT_279961 [Kalaharituber pfeilii]|nr:hypothetical protein BDZ91DRAFT_279961 [Kalaharituber pfeilii]
MFGNLRLRVGCIVVWLQTDWAERIGQAITRLGSQRLWRSLDARGRSASARPTSNPDASTPARSPDVMEP